MNSNSKVIPGTINLQGSSYSGADIKIMILSRNADLLKKTYEQQLAALDAEGAALETELRALTAGYDHRQRSATRPAKPNYNTNKNFLRPYIPKREPIYKKR
jgi:hypothetical protein